MRRRVVAGAGVVCLLITGTEAASGAAPWPSPAPMCQVVRGDRSNASPLDSGVESRSTSAPLPCGATG